MAIIEQDVNAAPDAPMPEPNSDAPRASKDDLLLDSLEITNFRAFRHLVVPKLGRVNLITGKNGVGKSSLLEALYLYAEGAWPDSVRQILTERGDVAVDPGIADNVYDRALLADIARLFHAFYESEEAELSIGSRKDNTRRLLLKYLTSVTALPQYDKIHINVRNMPIEYNTSSFTTQANIRFPPNMRSRTTLPVNFLKTNRQTSVNSEKTWSRAIIDSQEDDVLALMRLIVPALDRIYYVLFDSFDARHTAVVRLHPSQSVVPLASLGEGLTQIFAIASALVTTQNGFLLIDEIENGLHYSVLPDVWRLIFQTARKLNVQVFATTHSWDCIEAFQQAATEDEESEGVLVRLLNKDGNVLSTVFDERRLAIVTRDGIEVR